MTDRRLPTSVYRTGEEPDVRFTLANERTFLAWIRTALALVAAGVALETFALELDATLRQIAATLLVTAGALAAVYAWISWARTEKALRNNKPLPAPIAGLVVVGVVTVAAIIIMIAILTSGT